MAQAKELPYHHAPEISRVNKILICGPKGLIKAVEGLVKILFLIKKRGGYGYGQGYYGSVGLWESVRMLSSALRERGIETIARAADDANSIDRIVEAVQPTHVFLEALWVTPEKLAEIVAIHPQRQWFARIHSDIPFLAMEGIAFPWMRGYSDVYPKVRIVANSIECTTGLNAVGIDCAYGPNYFRPVQDSPYRPWDASSEVLRAGSLGAMRPLKNQLMQAAAAMRYANLAGLHLEWNTNATRTEQQGSTVLKNLRALFEGTRHTLVELPWMPRQMFFKRLQTLDLSMNVSFTETFNIVAADSIYAGCSTLGSYDIPFIPTELRPQTTSSDSILAAIEAALGQGGSYFNTTARIMMEVWNKLAIDAWMDLLA